MSGPLVVVTGASAGIGEALSRRLAADGARVVMLARREERLAAIGAECGAAWVACDLSRPDDVAGACARILAEHGVPDVVVNNAGGGRFQSIEETSSDDARAQMALPYFAAFDVTRGLIEPMLTRGSGTIFQVNSPVAVVPWPGAVGYAAARYAVRGFTAALRQDLAGTGLRVGSLTPTRVRSDYFDANPGSVERVPRVEALVGVMDPDEVAAAIVDALGRRPGSDTHVPWRWGLLAPIARAVPAPFAWLFRLTGHRRQQPGYSARQRRV